VYTLQEYTLSSLSENAIYEIEFYFYKDKLIQKKGELPLLEI
jgi:hypothetical protein